VHGDVLRAFAVHAAHQFAEAGLGVLQQPVTGQPTVECAARTGGVFLVLVILTRLSYWLAREQDSLRSGFGRRSVVSAEEFRRLKGERSGDALIAAMQASPHRDIDIEPKRDRMPVRGVDL
jgi:hypothetical protein